MNTRQRQAEIEHIAKQVVHRALPNTSELPDGFYVVKVQNGFARHVPFDEVMGDYLASLIAKMNARDYEDTIGDLLAGPGRQ